MSWVLDRGGSILYKAMWTSAARIGEFFERRQSQRAGHTVAPVNTEQIELREIDRAAFRKGLERNGPRAATEFARAEEIWADRARVSRS
jgi:hypothetical protein